jgi:far upstream element-binding protein
MADAAQAIAEKLVQQHQEQQPEGTDAAATNEEEEAPAANNNNKRKFEDGDAPAEDAEEQPLKKANFAGAEGERQTEGEDEAAAAAARTTGFDAAPAAAAVSAPATTNGVAATAPAAQAAALQAAQTAASFVQQSVGGVPTLSMQIPATMVGKVIGKGGETIKNLQSQSRTRIQIDHTAPGETKTVTITSDNADYLKAAEQMIQQVISDDGSAGEVHQSVDCPPGIVGRVIGRGGETIRALQQASQAHIVVDQNFPEGENRKVNISGRHDAVDRAVKMVTELIAGEPGSATAIIQKYGAGVTRTMDCPKEMVGRVIGKGGETIKAMQREFQANIQIDQSQIPMKITISGQPASVERAYGVVSEIVAGGNPYIGGSVGHAVQGMPPSGGGGPGMGRGGGGGPSPGGYGGAPNPYGQGAPGGFGAPAYGGYGGAPAYPQAAPQPYGGYGGAPAYGGYGGYGAPAAPAAYGGGGYGAPAAGGYGADPYAAQAQQGYGAAAGYGAHQPAQPSPWQELTDNEGRPYYYNSQTGVSQWEKPADM